MRRAPTAGFALALAGVLAAVAAGGAATRPALAAGLDMGGMLAAYKEGSWTWAQMAANAMPYRILEVASPEPGKKYPLIFHMHSNGAQGTDNMKTFYAISDTYLFDPRTLGQRNAAWKAYVIVPQIPDTRSPARWRWSYNPSGAANADNWPTAAIPDLIEFLKARYPIDADRIYATGVSMGGHGVWEVMWLYPKLFAAGVAMCGLGQEPKAADMLGKPIWALHNVADNVVPIDGSRPNEPALYVGSRTMMNKLKDLGSPVLFTEPAQPGGQRMLPATTQRHIMTAYTMAEDPNNPHQVEHKALNELQLPVWLFAQTLAPPPSPDAGAPDGPGAGADAAGGAAGRGGAGGAGGATGGGGAGGDGAGGGAQAGAGGAGDPGDDWTDGVGDNASGCACRLGGRADATSAAPLALAVALAFAIALGRRRRARP